MATVVSLPTSSVFKTFGIKTLLFVLTVLGSILVFAGTTKAKWGLTAFAVGNLVIYVYWICRHPADVRREILYYARLGALCGMFAGAVGGMVAGYAVSTVDPVGIRSNATVFWFVVGGLILGTLIGGFSGSLDGAAEKKDHYSA